MYVPPGLTGGVFTYAVLELQQTFPSEIKLTYLSRYTGRVSALTLTLARIF